MNLWKRDLNQEIKFIIKKLKEYGTFVDYAWNSDEECHVDFVMNNTIEQRHVSVNCLCFADEV